MKRLIIGYSVIAASTFLLASCEIQQSETKRPKNTQEGTSRMKQRTKTATGLEYEIKQAGTGKSPEKGQKVTVHYTGWLADANGNPIMEKEFDSSFKRNQPFSFTIGMGQVIKGWDEGVMMMKEGEKRRLVIPANLAYGARSIGSIPANSVLVFDVELIRVG